MHGLIVNQLRAYLVERLGRPAWTALLDRSGMVLADGVVPIDASYPDPWVDALVLAAAEAAGRPIAELLEEFGVFLAPALLRVYAPLVPREWRTLDVVMHAETHVHTAVRMRDPLAGPPLLNSVRVGSDQVVVTYGSPRRMCAVAVGIVRGLAAHFGEQVEVSQTACMHSGDAVCVIAVKRLSA